MNSERKPVPLHAARERERRVTMSRGDHRLFL
jgi:hypothetical protein